MTNAELKTILVDCRAEIAYLRNQIAIMHPKADAWDQLRTVLQLLPKPRQTQSPDVVHLLDKELEKIHTAEATRPL